MTLLAAALGAYATVRVAEINKQPIDKKQFTSNFSTQNQSSYFVIGFTTPNSAEAERESLRRNKEGYNTKVLNSSDWSNLNPNFYIVVYGIYENQNAAKSMMEMLRSRGIDGAYVRYSGEPTLPSPK